MRAPLPSRSARGYALVELMIASVILIVAMTGFVAAMKEAVSSTAIAHRRTEGALLRTGLLERLTVARRDVVGALGALTVNPASPAWVVESCYDVDAVLLGENPGLTGGGWDQTVPNPAFCPAAGAKYRRWVSATPIPDATGGAQRVWRVSVYVERTDQGCTALDRFFSVGCVGADTYLTD